MSDDTESIESLKGVIEELRTKVAELEDKVSELEDAAASVGNLAGDEDTSPGNGYINVDASVARHPVIRFRADRLPSGGEGGGVEYVCGDDSMITFTECTDQEDERHGKTMIDVYYV